MGFEEFILAAKEAKRIAFSFADPLIVHHYDADGISSGAIVKAAFVNENRKHRMLALKKLDDSSVESLKKENEIIFVDLGNNERVAELKDVLVIDHHQVKESGKPQINPMLHGLDGGSELSSSGTAFFTFGNNADLGVVGALGDMQYPLQGANAKMVEEGIAKGEVKQEFDLRFYGRYSRPLVQFLAYNDEPYVPGISYNEGNALRMLMDLGIELKKAERDRRYADLNSKEKKHLISGIAEIVSRRRDIRSLVGDVYELPKRPNKSMLRDANEFSTVLNACGRHGKPELGIAVCMGEETAYLEASAFILLHKRMIREGIEFAGKNVVDLGPFLFLDARGVVDEGLVGIVCGMLLHGSLKPILGISIGEENTIKVSSRVNKASGINLGKVMGCAEKVKGVGGGHVVAAGANIPSEKLNEFLIYCGENIREQRGF
ncbi:DHH family phosphoesterase [Candidatus Micrarchaeota archaeon]|nr:DHH family phosphoesterase [Candidatus Micrarchaeota archaeon]